MKRIKIGEAAGQTGTTTRTIRYYEELGLLGQKEKRPPGKIRWYDRRDLARLKKIQTLKELGLSLEEIARVIDLYFTDGHILEGKLKVIEILKGHAAVAGEKIKELSAFKEECEKNIARLEKIVDNYRHDRE